MSKYKSIDYICSEWLQNKADIDKSSKTDHLFVTLKVLVKEKQIQT